MDPGLASTLEALPQYARLAPSNLGKHRVPTLRNVDKRAHPGFVKAYGHNGYFKSLEAVVHFYSTRDVLPPPEVVANMNREELGDLKLNPVEEAALVAFLRTLSDGYQPPRSNRASTPVQPALTGPAGRWPPLYTRVPAHAASP